MKKSAWYVVLLALVLVVAVVLTVGGLDFGKDKQPDEDEDPVVTQQQVVTAPPTAAVETPELPVETPTAPTQPPVFVTKEPVSTPEPTPTVTETPNVNASGSFSSNTGTGLNIQVDWKAYNAANGAPKLQVDVSATSYSFYTSALWNAVTVTVNGSTYSANSPDIAYDGSALVITPMASFTMDAPTGNVSIEAVWDYKGSYSGVELSAITASGTAYIG